MAKRSGTSIKTKIYNKFRGVDFTTDPSLVDDSRSPLATNMISDAGGMPEKRTGYRDITNLCYESSGVTHTVNVKGLCEFKWYDSINDAIQTHYIAVSDWGIHRWYTDGTSPSVLTEFDTHTGISCSFAILNNLLIIFTGVKAYVYDGSTVSSLESKAYVPTTVIGRSPSGGGTNYEAINYLTGKQTISAMGDGTSREYKLPYAPVDSVNKVVVNGTETSAYTVDLTNGKVTFTTAPGTPSVSGQDNVFITFTKNVAGYPDKINRLTTAFLWGVSGNADRIVATGDPKNPNYDYICGYNDPTYWSDKDYSIVGTPGTAIMGYRRINEQLAIFKSDNGKDATIFLRSGSLDDNGNAEFTVRACLSGIGAISERGFGNILDDQMLLTKKGIYALTTLYLTSEKIVEDRSIRIDPRLIKEDLEDAFMVNFKNMLMTFVDDRVYGLDGKQKVYTSRNDTNYNYESYYWELHTTPTCGCTMVESGEDQLYFGTAEGRICKFNFDVDSLLQYSDEVPVAFTDPTTLTEDEYEFTYDGEHWILDKEIADITAYGITAPINPMKTSMITIINDDDVYKAHYYVPIEAIWSSKADDDGDAMVYKTLLKKGNAVTIKPYARSSAKILMRTDKDPSGWQANEGTMDIFDWEDIDFERFTFESNDAPSEIPVNRKVKNYKRLQIIVKNDVLNEGFGVYGITKHYVTGNFAKR